MAQMEGLMLNDILKYFFCKYYFLVPKLYIFLTYKAKVDSLKVQCILYAIRQFKIGLFSDQYYTIYSCYCFKFSLNQRKLFFLILTLINGFRFKYFNYD